MAEFLATWRHTVSLRLRYLVRPYAQAFGSYLAAYAGATALLQPWAWGGWWAFWAPFVGGFGVCWWLWRPWALLARNYKGESRRLPLLFAWMLCLAVSWNVRQCLHARLGEVRDLRSVRELAQPGTAIFFRLHGPFYVAKLRRGQYATTDFTKSKNGTKTYYANCFYACPLLSTAADTAAAALPVPAWLGYIYREELGYNLSPGEVDWRSTNAVARFNARFDTLTLTHFTYLERKEASDLGLYLAVRASRLAPRTEGEPLLLTPVQAPFAMRGLPSLKLALTITLLGSAIISFLLLVMELRPPAYWPDLIE
ncbi:hypothetical protein GKZ68_12540 [Hymenobacter sp. BRD128]|uniref:hypothetical protein n=1 Tax=Hymenobacter sp. BRD128 TaxID=2675878 RepID=UPI001564904F|nr:hypothetical protein [Hymenobacter sp. BRD128]QKG57373.1 hypothetical protein GKZ68_12540 [Hymenobacter sp. BRD128]